MWMEGFMNLNHSLNHKAVKIFSYLFCTFIYCVIVDNETVLVNYSSLASNHF